MSGIEGIAQITTTVHITTLHITILLSGTLHTSFFSRTLHVMFVCIPIAWPKTSQASKSVCGARFIPSSCHPWCVVERSLVVFCLSLSPVSLRRLSLFFHTLPDLCPALLLPCRQRRGLKPLRTRTMSSIAAWRYTILSQVMSPSSSTTSTTQRLLQRSSRMNPATQIRSLRTRVTRNSTMRLSEKRYLHHCSFRSEKNQRTWDKLITLMKKVCCQLSPFSRTLVPGDPYTNPVRLKNEHQVATWKTKESRFSLKDKKRANSR